MTPPGTAARRVVAFNAVGIAGFVVQTVVLWSLVRVGHVGCVPAALLAVETAIVHNFICHWCWTWSDRVGGRGEFLRRLAVFNATNGAVSLAVNAASMALLQRVFAIDYLAANLAGLAAGAAINFVLGDRVVFAARRAACVRRGGPARRGRRVRAAAIAPAPASGSLPRQAASRLPPSWERRA